jgi:TetR/AcrR family transcriptional repressor of nem operon
MDGPRESIPEMAARSDKKERLVDSAMRLFYSQGFARTSLAEVADGAGIMLGNLYYYFKTKDSLAEAVIAGYHLKIEEWHAQASLEQTPTARLRAWVDYYEKLCLDVLDWGCPFGRLLLDFKQQSEALGDLAGQLYFQMLQWVTLQFAAFPDGEQHAGRHARELVARAQGISVLALIIRERKTIEDHFDDLRSSLPGEF